MTGLFSKLFGRKNRIDVGRITENETEESNSTFRAERSNSFVEITVVTDQGHRRKGVALDVSETGARLRFQTAENMVSPIRLKIPSLKMDCAADVVWHKGVDVGVRFS